MPPVRSATIAEPSTVTNAPSSASVSRSISACTRPTDRILVQAYLPQVTAMARRAFAGGHADLRPGFFTSESAQRLTVSRLERQSVPIVLLDTGESLEGFRESFPIVTARVLPAATSATIRFWLGVSRKWPRCTSAMRLSPARSR